MIDIFPTKFELEKYCEKTKRVEIKARQKTIRCILKFTQLKVN